MRDFRIFKRLNEVKAGDLRRKTRESTKDIEPSKMAEQASGVVNMLARVSDKGVMSAAEYADVSEAQKDGYWPDANDITISTVLLEDVPVDVARQLYSVGSPDDHFADGRDAWGCAVEYCLEEGRPPMDPTRSRMQPGRQLTTQKKEMEPMSDDEITIANKNAHRPWSDEDKKKFIKRGHVSHTEAKKVKEGSIADEVYSIAMGDYNRLWADKQEKTGWFKSVSKSLIPMFRKLGMSRRGIDALLMQAERRLSKEQPYEEAEFQAGPGSVHTKRAEFGPEEKAEMFAKFVEDAFDEQHEADSDRLIPTARELDRSIKFDPNEKRIGAMEAKLIQLREARQKLYEDGAPVRTKPEVPVPTKVPEPRRRPASPLKPGPGQRPKPKAGVSHDMELFIANRKGGVDEMAFEPGKSDALINPDWKDWIESGGGELKELLPELGNAEQSYLEMITSESYQQMIDRVEKATGTDIDSMNLPGLVSMLLQSLEKVEQLESGHNDDLERLAVKVVLDLPEFEMFKDAYENDQVQLDVKLVTDFPELNLQARREEEGLSNEEQMNTELFGVLDGADEDMLRRRLANLIIQGNASIKMQLYKMIVPELEAIDPSLPEIYGLLAISAELGYWAMPKKAAQSGGMSIEGGSAEVTPEGEDYVIHAHAMCFPYLVHELVKGIYEWVAINPESQAGERDTIGQESEDMIAGPGVVRSITSYVSTEDQKYIPLLKKLILQRSRDEIRAILSHSPEGEKLVKELLAQAKQQTADYDEDVMRSDAEEF